MKKLIIGILALTGCTTVSEHNTLLLPAGKTMEFFHASEVNRSCVALGVPEITVIVPPSHGKVDIIKTKLKPNGFKPGNSRYKCRNTLVDGVVAKYTANAGYKGRDFVRIRVKFHFDKGPNGEDYIARVTYDDFAESFHVQ
ncbi:hypothetical protein ASG42_26860 [Rhizobium sp. Leaf391]|uniref:hypothetical protein n=1 Tax=Rhizobium sp. Leaf391 TaxID=1736360 RepID=UPI0007153790|nr:hypothetical protein [Rhizobium sp. Leaf391]KQT01633.1 hypothetical protein ASG42_26860 [Rhizobium sp. Leaf391]